MSVKELSDRLVDFDGQRVRVRGWVEDCVSNSCSIEGRKDASISLGPSPTFDAAVANRLGETIVVEATVNVECKTRRVICLDRVGTLRDPVLLTSREY